MTSARSTSTDGCHGKAAPAAHDIRRLRAGRSRRGRRTSAIRRLRRRCALQRCVCQRHCRARSECTGSGGGGACVARVPATLVVPQRRVVATSTKLLDSDCRRVWIQIVVDHLSSPSGLDVSSSNPSLSGRIRGKTSRSFTARACAML